METALKLVETKTDTIGPQENPILKKFAIEFAPENQPTFDCNECSDTGRVFIKTEYRGKMINNVKKCECVFRKVRAQKLAIIPEAFRSADLETLRADNSIHPKQSQYVELVKANPLDRYVISGDFGTGKTHLFWCLYGAAVRRNRRTYANTLRGLIAEFQKAIELSQAGERFHLPLTAEDLRQSHTPYSVFLDDIDKARATEYTAEQLFEIVDACYSFGHQLVVTTNLRTDDLLEHFRGADRKRSDDGFGRYGGAIVRRLLDNAHEIEMF
jgi:DNA replication protein DnaC